MLRIWICCTTFEKECKRMKKRKIATKYLSASLNKDTTFSTTNWTFYYFSLRFVALIKNLNRLLIGIWEH